MPIGKVKPGEYSYCTVLRKWSPACDGDCSNCGHVDDDKWESAKEDEVLGECPYLGYDGCCTKDEGYHCHIRDFTTCSTYKYG